ncbi:MAG TPA: hypothetical protein VFT49_00215 [Candidatus Saccharimonadales bacterium]|nr:hypothetical protein [Candidatus Saccharimonadales bacterium]
MADWVKIVLTAAVTLIGGTILFGVSEVVKVLVLAPLQKFKAHVQLTLDRIDFYANRITNPFSENPTDDERRLMAQIQADLRSAATGLSSTYVTISLRKVLIKLKIIPKQEAITKAYGALMYLSNSLLVRGHMDEADNPRNNHAKIEEIKAALL